MIDAGPGVAEHHPSLNWSGHGAGAMQAVACRASQNGGGMDRTDEYSGSSSEERTWGAIVHLSALSGLLIPFGNLLGPLVVWLIKRNELAQVDEEGKEALNFQITMTLAMLLSIPAMFIGIGGVLFVVIYLGDIILSIKAAVHASKDDHYSYPLTMRLIS